MESLSDNEEHFEFSPSPELYENNRINGSLNASKLSNDSFRSTSSTSSGGHFSRNNQLRQSFNQRNSSWLRSSLRRTHEGPSANGSANSSKRLSANAQASQMFRSSPSNGTSPGSRRSSLSCDSDEVGNDPISLEDDVIDLTQKIASLQQQVTALNESQNTNDDRYTRVKQENATLLSKIHALEEQLRDIELQSDERRKEEEKRYRDAMSRHEREKSYESEQYINRIYSLQQELLEARDESRKYQNIIEKIRNDKSELEELIVQKSDEVEGLREEIMRLKELTRRHRDEEIANGRVIDVLNQELDEMRRIHNSDANNKRSSANDLREMKIVNELDEELRKLKTENRGLKEVNEELQAQLLNNHLEEGRTLLREGQKAASLAEELGSLTIDQLRKTLVEKQDDNNKLRTYIDGILLNIVENYPQLLEVKS